MPAVYQPVAHGSASISGFLGNVFRFCTVSKLGRVRKVTTWPDLFLVLLQKAVAREKLETKIRKTSQRTKKYLSFV